MGGNIPLRDASVLPSMPGNLRGLSFLLASSLCPPNAEKKNNKAQRGGPANRTPNHLINPRSASINYDFRDTVVVLWAKAFVAFRCPNHPRRPTTISITPFISYALELRCSIFFRYSPNKILARCCDIPPPRPPRRYSSWCQSKKQQLCVLSNGGKQQAAPRI